MAKITDTNAYFAGKEPKYDRELTKSELIDALNWYANNKEVKDSIQYGCTYFKKHFHLNPAEALKNKAATFGFVCRILLNGGCLPIENQAWFEKQIEDIKERIRQEKPTETIDTTPSNVISIQDRILEKVATIGGELEGAIDDYILSGFTTSKSPFSIMQNTIKGVHAKYIIDIFKKHRAEYDEVLHSDDSDLREGYSNFTKTQLKKLVAYCDQIILDAMKISNESLQTRKPKKRKQKTPEQLVKKLNYAKEFSEFNLVSVNPEDIIGCMQLWVYNTKNKKLGCYHAEDAAGLSVKGSTILNYNDTKSTQKTLRKPAEVLPTVLTGGKVFMRNVLENIKTTESRLTGRINTDTILLRITK